MRIDELPGAPTSFGHRDCLSPGEPSRYEREAMGVHEPVRNEELGL